MSAVVSLVLILKSMAISLGVGASTIAIVNFFAAIKDGRIDETERNMMGVTYVVLRVAMVVILLTELFLMVHQYGLVGTAYFTPLVSAEWILIFVLYGNAILMTMCVMPSTVGPALQASSWYTLGILQTLIPLGLTGFSLVQFGIGYACAVALGVSIVNGMMAYFKSTRGQTPAELKKCE